MEIIIKTQPEEIAALVSTANAVQERQRVIQTSTSKQKEGDIKSMIEALEHRLSKLRSANPSRSPMNIL